MSTTKYSLEDYSELVWKNGEQMTCVETLDELHALQSENAALRLSLSGKTQHDQVEEYKKGLREKIEKEMAELYPKLDNPGLFSRIRERMQNEYSTLKRVLTLINEP